TKVTEHLDTCETCPALYAELTDLNTNLAALLAPGILGTTWAAYLGISTATKTGILAALGAAGTATTTGIRETIQKIGPRDTAIGAGTAAAIAAAAIAATLLSGNPPPPAPPAGQPEPTTAPTEAPPVAPPVAPTESPEPTPSDEPEPPAVSPTPASPAPAPSSPPPSPLPSKTKKPLPTPSHPTPPKAPLLISPGDNGTRFTSGRSSVLPVRITNHSAGGAGGGYVAEPPREGVMTLVVELPAGFRFTGEPSGDGWRCARIDGGAECSRTAIRPGESTTAELRVHVDKHVSGVREVTAHVALDELTADLTYRVTVERDQGGYRPKYQRTGSIPE
ncbi:MAG: hypothetical protein ACRDT6_26490, partial [Micromonosporaceae bacterium]